MWAGSSPAVMPAVTPAANRISLRRENNEFCGLVTATSCPANCVLGTLLFDGFHRRSAVQDCQRPACSARHFDRIAAFREGVGLQLGVHAIRMGDPVSSRGLSNEEFAPSSATLRSFRQRPPVSMPRSDRRATRLTAFGPSRRRNHSSLATARRNKAGDSRSACATVAVVAAAKRAEAREARFDHPGETHAMGAPAAPSRVSRPPRTSRPQAPPPLAGTAHRDLARLVTVTAHRPSQLARARLRLNTTLFTDNPLPATRSTSSITWSPA